MRKLDNIKILEYYDVPQILTADDATGTHYLCTLINDSGKDGFEYIGVQISRSKLNKFTAGQLDLRDAYLNPEVENAVYLVVVKDDNMYASKLLSPEDITENILPESGYFYECDENKKEVSDIYELEVPVLDRTTFRTFADRMGWRISARQERYAVV